MVSESEYFTIGLADYEALDELGVVYSASRQRHESECPRRNSDVHISSQLSTEERKTLVSGGAVIDDTPQSQEAVKELANECRGLINASLNQKSVTSLLHISAEILSLMTTQRPPELHSFRLKHSQLLYPAWQFSASETIPHLRKLLSQAPADAHVLSMSRFMMEKNMDLAISDSGQHISPRDWLIAGYDPEPVMVILSDL
jgi:hypothetical protein